MPTTKKNLALRLAVTNCLIFLLLFLALEYGLRTFKVFQTCQTTCEWALLNSTTGYFAENFEIGISQFDPILGYVPKPNFHADTMSGWHQSHATIDKDGLRDNGNASKYINSEFKILAVGDSFTFGYQVDDKETWPSCAERSLGVQVKNGGVFGYGAAQSSLRAEIISRNKYFDVAILSILVGHGFARDQLSFRSGFSKPAVTVKAGHVSFSEPIRLSEFTRNQSLLMTALGNMRNISFVMNDFLDLLNITPAAPRMSLLHPHAAPIPSIVEFTLKRFAAINAGEKMVLLQYTEPDAKSISKTAKNELALIYSEASKYGITVLDSNSFINKHPPSTVWFGHHTPFGNKLVCDAVVAGLNASGPARVKVGVASVIRPIVE